MLGLIAEHYTQVIDIYAIFLAALAMEAPIF